jgi:hypothetical protein
MKYLKIYENFMDSRNSGIAADLEAGEIENDQIYADMDADNFGTEESQFGAEEILAKWQEAFGDKEPTTQEKYDFYSDLRQEGFDGMLIFDTLGEKMYNEEDETEFEVQNESSEEGCMDCKCSPCKCNEDKEEDQEDKLDEDCSSCNCKPCECK